MSPVVDANWITNTRNSDWRYPCPQLSLCPFNAGYWNFFSAHEGERALSSIIFADLVPAGKSVLEIGAFLPGVLRCFWKSGHSSAMTDMSEQLAAMIDGFVRTQMVASAVRLELPGHLAGRTCSTARLSVLTGIGIHELRRYLRALEGLGLVETVEPDACRGTELMGLLRQDTGGLYGHALLAGREYYQAWSELDYSLRTGNAAFEHRHGHSLWRHLGRSDEATAWFARTMQSNTERFLPEILGLCKFPDNGVVADIGAGDGLLLAELLKRYPKLRGVAFEQPSSIALIRRTMNDYGVADRCEFVAGDFLTEVPVKADLHIIKTVIHNWDDGSALRILRNCRAAVGEHGRLLLIERTARTEDVLAEAILDLSMLVLFGGRSRSVKEYSALLQQAGFSAERTLTRQSGLFLIETRADHTITADVL